MKLTVTLTILLTALFIFSLSTGHAVALAPRNDTVPAEALHRRSGDGPPVVPHDEKHRHIEHRREVQPGVEVALARRSLGEVAHAHVVLLRELVREADPGGLRHLRRERRRDRHKVERGRAVVHGHLPALRVAVHVRAALVDELVQRVAAIPRRGEWGGGGGGRAALSHIAQARGAAATARRTSERPPRGTGT